MKLRTATIRNYRVHRELELAFGDGLTVIAAVNESGKSTLMEAVHRALFLHCRSGGELRKGMLSRAGGDPEVELTFTADGTEWHLRKVFKGGSGVCHLADRGGGRRYEDDEAEARLGELTGQEVLRGRSANQLQACWDHLWTWQGASGDDPLQRASAGELFAALAGRAEADEVVLTPADRALIEQVRGAVDAELDSRGNFRAGSRVREHERRADEVAARRASLEERREETRSRAEQLAAHRRGAAEAEAALAEAEPRLAELEAVVAGLEEERRRVEPAQRELAEAGERLAAFREALATAARREAELSELEERCRVGAEEVEALRRRRGAATAQVQRLDAELRATRDEHRRLEAQAEVVGLAEELASCERELARLEAQAARHADLERAAADARRTLSETPEVTDADLERLRRLDTALAEQRAGLQAVSTSLTWTDGPAPVRLDGEELARDQERLVDRPAELRCADGTTLRVLPGGGEDLDERRQALEAAERARAEALEELGAGSVARAETMARHHRERREASERAQERLEEHHDPEAELAGCRREHQRLRARGEELRERGIEPPAGVGLDELGARLDDLRIGIDRREESLAEAREEEQASRDALEEAEARSRRDEEMRAECRGQVAESAERLGDADARRAREVELAAAHREAERAFDAIRDKLERGDLEGRRRALELERKRVARLREEHVGHRHRGDVLEGQLAEGSEEDLEGEIERSTAEEERLRRAAAEARLRLAGSQRLLGVLEDLQLELQARRERPFLDACREYLGLAFGAGGRLGLDGEGERRVLRAIDRSDAGLGVFDFDELSHGARELVAAAVTLAMAEVVAAERDDGSLPVWLDDAFVNVDPERFPQVGLLLAQAADRGLQVLMATCDTRKARSLGAERVIDLQRPVAPTAGPAPASADRQVEEASPSATTADAGDDATALLAAIAHAGGEGSTRALRAALGWDRSRFEEARRALEADGRIVQPPGTRALRAVE